MQEVTPSLLGSLRSAAEARGWAVRACGAETLALTLDDGACGALTCIVTAAASKAEATADIEVEARQSGPAAAAAAAAARVSRPSHSTDAAAC